MKNLKKRFELILPYIPKSIGAITTTLFVCAAVGMIATGLMPWFYIIFIAIAGLVSFQIIIKPLFGADISRKKGVFLSVISIVISVICVGVLSFSSTFINFLREIQTDNQNTETYSVIAKRSRSMTIDKAKTAGMVQTDPYIEDAKRELSKHINSQTKELATTQAVMDNLTDETLDVIALNSGNLQLTKETNGEFDRDFEVIFTFTISVTSTKSSTEQTISDSPFIVYISGIDTYGSIGTTSRSDVNMIAVVNPRDRRLLLVNTPRDYYVQLHNTSGTKDKLTHAGLYGIDMSRQTLEDLYDIEIPYYIRVNFSSIISLVDVIGGVNVYSDYTFGQFHEGYNQLDGKQALQFSRERYSFTDGDRQRGRNQQKVIEAIVSKMSSPSTLIKYQSVLNSVQAMTQTNLASATITSLVNNQLSNPRDWTVRSISINGTGSTESTYTMGNQPLYVMIPDDSSVERARKEIKILLQ